MLWTQLKTVAAVILVAGTVLATGRRVAAVHAGKGQSDVRPGPAPEDRADRAQVVRSLSFDNYNLVPGETTILSILPANAKVKKGQLVCELDPARIKDQLSNQKITTQGGRGRIPERQADARGRRNRRQRVHGRDLQTRYGSGPWRAQTRGLGSDPRDRPVEWADRMDVKGYVTKGR